VRIRRSCQMTMQSLFVEFSTVSTLSLVLVGNAWGNLFLLRGNHEETNKTLIIRFRAPLFSANVKIDTVFFQRVFLLTFLRRNKKPSPIVGVNRQNGRPR
jgi:hypothetical protein